jgi:hypothetical protein
MFEVQEREKRGEGRANCTRPREKIGESSVWREQQTVRQQWFPLSSSLPFLLPEGAPSNQEEPPTSSPSAVWP